MRILFASVLVLLPPALLALGLVGAGATASPPALADPGDAGFASRSQSRSLGAQLLDRAVDDRAEIGMRGDDDDDDDDFRGVAEFFVEDPRFDPSNVVEGDALDRLTWQADDPAFPGDPAGSLTALYDSTLPPGLFGIPLGTALTQDHAFTAGAVFVIRSEGFRADPNGFFQISWGLWNTEVTGLNRTGNLDDFASDSFELVEFDWFPNASDFFGGPFLGPTVLGEATGDPADAFSNGGYLFGFELDLPFDVPLLAVMQHRPGDDAMVVQIHTIDGDGRVLPLNGAVGVVPLGFMASRHYAVDAVGPTLWQDGFSGPEPAVRAELVYHALVVAPGVVNDPRSLLP